MCPQPNDVNSWSNDELVCFFILKQKKEMSTRTLKIDIKSTYNSKKESNSVVKKTENVNPNRD